MPPQPQSPEHPTPSNTQTIIFMVVLSFVCALILALLASALQEPKEIAKDLDRSKQMMIAAKILNHAGYFQVRNSEGKFVPAVYSKEEGLKPTNLNPVPIPTQSELLDVYRERLKPLLVDNKGNVTTFAKAHIKEEEYITEFKKKGYYTQPYKLLYAIRPNAKERVHDEENDGAKIGEIEGYVIPVNGFGLWDAIYGYLAIAPDANTIIGITWYDQKETPGLGANITEESWQKQFDGKHIFQASPTGQVDFKTAPLGIIVVRGKVSEVLGNVPKAASAVDGMAGATLTGNGVTQAYQDVLTAYRPFLIRLHEEYKKDQKT